MAPKLHSRGTKSVFFFISSLGPQNSLVRPSFSLTFFSVATFFPAESALERVLSFPLSSVRMVPSLHSIRELLFSHFLAFALSTTIHQILPSVRDRGFPPLEE